MTLFQAIALGLVQGLGEFLPISSSGHLVVAPWLLGFPDPGLSFDVALHLGTLLAVVIYFWKDFIEIIKNSISPSPSGRGYPDVLVGTGEGAYSSNILWLIILATIPGALFGYFLENYAETTFRHPLLVAFTLSFVGLILYLADRSARQIKNINKMTKKDALLIGISQALAIIPGVSRAGATITTGLFLGLDRASAARFSFLMSAPIIFGASLLKLPEFFSSALTYIEIIGILVAAASGYAAIAFMLRFIERVSYKIFFWYRLALALIILFFWTIK
jgi:undecaprenyl-diphosphatase